MNKLIIVGLGGFIGALLRYLVSGWIQKNPTPIPYGTLGVNIIGSFLIGLIMFSVEYEGFFSEDTRIFLTIGVLGSFTTMSTFSYETIKLIENNQYLYFLLNVVGNVFLSLIAVILGKNTTLLIWR